MICQKCKQAPGVPLLLAMRTVRAVLCVDCRAINDANIQNHDAFKQALAVADREDVKQANAALNELEKKYDQELHALNIKYRDLAQTHDALLHQVAEENAHLVTQLRELAQTWLNS